MTKQIVYFVYRKPFPIDKLSGLNWYLSNSPVIYDWEIVGNFPISQAFMPYCVIGGITLFQCTGSEFVVYFSNDLAIEYINEFYGFYSSQEYTMNGAVSTGYIANTTLPALNTIGMSGNTYMEDNGYSWVAYDPNYAEDGYELAPTAIDISKNPAWINALTGLGGAGLNNPTEGYYMLVFNTDYAQNTATNVVVTSTGSVSTEIISTTETVGELQQLSENLATQNKQEVSFPSNGEIISTEVSNDLNNLGKSLNNVGKSLNNAINADNPTFDLVVGGIIIVGIIAIAIVLKK